MVSATAWAQPSSQRLKAQQQELEKKIGNTKSLLEKTAKNTKISYEEVQLVERQIEYREQLLRNIDNQIRSSELKIKQKETRIEELNAEIEYLKKQYAELLLYAYKKRNKYGQLMYLFNAQTIEEAMKRKLYLEKLADIQKKQMRIIKQNQHLLAEEIEALNEEKRNQEELAVSKKKERAEIVKTKQKKEEIYRELKHQEEELKQELAQQEQDRERLKQEVAAAIQREIAEERVRQVKAFVASGNTKIDKKDYQGAIRDFSNALSIESNNTAARNGKAKAEKLLKAENKEATVELPKKEEDFPFIAENKLEGKNFAANKGRLPWPVSKGTIFSNYGKHRNPNLPNVFTQNNGIDISTTLNANALAVYKGTVSSIISIPGAGKVVIIKHGNYRTVYSNLQNVYVSKNSEVDTRTPIGSLLPSPNGNTSIVHFEIHEVDNNDVKQLNPNLWISK